MIIPDYVERHARLSPDKKAIIFEERVCTYLELKERVFRLANGLKRPGLREGDSVMKGYWDMPEETAISMRGDGSTHGTCAG